jgi:hypothetical protein
VPVAVGVLGGDSLRALTEGSALPKPEYDALIAVFGLIVAGLLSRGGRASRIWRGYGWCLAIALLFGGAVAAQNLAAGVTPRYYFIKALHLIIAVLAVGIGAVATLLPASWRATRRGGRRPLIDALPAVLLAVAIGGASGLFFGQGMYQHQFDRHYKTWTRAWTDRDVARTDDARRVLAAYDAYPPVSGTMSLILHSTPRIGYVDSLYLSALQRTSGITVSGIYTLPYDDALARVQQITARVPGKIRFIVTDPGGFAGVDRALAAQPELRSRVTVVALPGVVRPAR